MKLEDTMFYFIAGHGRGWAFSSSDLLERFSRQEIDNTLSDLAAKSKIRRVSRGIYDYPKYSELLKKYLSPDIWQVAHAYARKSNWRIEVSGESALNMLGLSTQVVGRYVYLSDGPSRSYEILGSVVLEFKKSNLKNIGFKYEETSLIVQALKSLGKERITDEILSKIRERTDEKMRSKILKDAKTATSWIYDGIKQICKKEPTDA